MKDGKKCSPVHVCDRGNNAGCSHVCNKDGKKARCSCNKGFKLLPDKMTCEKGINISGELAIFCVKLADLIL